MVSGPAASLPRDHIHFAVSAHPRAEGLATPLTLVFDPTRSFIGSIGRKRSLVSLYASTITFTTVLSIAAGIFFIYNLYHAGGEEQIKKCETNAQSAQNAQGPTVADPRTTANVNHWVCQTGFATGRVVVVVVYVIFWLLEICPCTSFLLVTEWLSHPRLRRRLCYCIQLRQPARGGGASRAARLREARAPSHGRPARIRVLRTAERLRRPFVSGRSSTP